MTSLFFQDHCGVLDVFQTCLMVFSPFSPGVHGRNWHFLELGDSLPGSGYRPARTLCVALCSPLCPWLLLDMVKGVPPFMLVGHDFGHAVSLWSIVLRVTPWRVWPEAPNSLAGSLGEVCAWRSQSFLRIRSCPKPLSRQGQDWILLEQTDEPDLLCAPCASEQKLTGVPRMSGGLCLASSQTLWVNLKVGCPGGVEL